jgi:hypothetical protein
MLRRLCPLLLAGQLLGCGGSESPEAETADHEEAVVTEADVKMPATYAAALPQIKAYRDAIRKAVDGGKPHDAHRPLDELDIVLQKLAPIAKSSGIAIEHWETINLTARELRSLFNQIHAAIDENRPADYQGVAKPIDEAIARLEQVTQ